MAIIMAVTVAMVMIVDITGNDNTHSAAGECVQCWPCRVGAACGVAAACMCACAGNCDGGGGGGGSACVGAASSGKVI